MLDVTTGRMIAQPAIVIQDGVITQLGQVDAPSGALVVDADGQDWFARIFGRGGFTLLPDPDFLYWSDNHARAYAMLEYGMLTHAPITVITGEIGAGKTTLLRHLLRTLPEEFTVGLISNAQGGRGELIRWALNAFDVAHDRTLDYVGLFQELQNFLLGEYAAGRHVVMVIDEAQNLSRADDARPLQSVDP